MVTRFVRIGTPQPIENLRIEPYANRHFPLDFTQPHQVCQLPIGQARDVIEVDAGIVPGYLVPGGTALFSRSFSVHHLISSELLLLGSAGRDNADGFFAMTTLSVRVYDQQHDPRPAFDASRAKGVPSLFPCFI